MKKHLFLTGPSGVGKSTLLRETLGPALAAAGGFVTERVTDSDGGMLAVELLPAAAAAGVAGFERRRILDFSTRPPRKDNEVFRRQGVRLLQEAVWYPFAVLDEIGGFELVIPQFRAALEELLNTPLPILGVLKGPANAAEIRQSFGLGEKYTLLHRRLHEALRDSADSMVLELTRQGDEQVGRVVRQWAREYAF